MQFIKRHLTLLILLLVLLAVVSVVVYPIFARQRGSRVETCFSHIHLLGMAMHQYVADYGDRLPNALTWPVDLQPYFRDDRSLHCPQDSCRGGRSYDMLQKRGYQRLPETGGARLVLFYEIGKHGAEYRHMAGMNIEFCDGHPKWYSREEMTPGDILMGVLPAVP